MQQAYDDTLRDFDRITSKCKDIFVKKLRLYGPSWRHFRPASLADQMLIKARRIRTLETKGHTAVGEGIIPEYQALVNYSVMTILQIRFGLPPEDAEDPLSGPRILELYDATVEEIRRLMLAKNADYGEAWRHMLPSSLTDMILVKLLRIRQLLVENSETTRAEALSNLQDIFNYSIFALILTEKTEI